MDYFMSVKKNGWNIAFPPDVIVEHDHQYGIIKDELYEKYRSCVEPGLRYFAHKRSLKYAYYFNGRVRNYKTLKERGFLRSKLKQFMKKTGIIKQFQRQFLRET